MAFVSFLKLVSCPKQREAQREVQKPLVSALISELSGPGSSPGQGHYVVVLGKILYSRSASLDYLSA